MTSPSSPWVVVLAGGDGRRLQGAYIHGRRLDRPKQFCSFLDAETLLRRALQRASQITEPGRIMVVVRDDHRRWWEEDLGDLPVENILSEPANRGTAVAILHALVHVLQREDDPTLVFLPSDHAAVDEPVLTKSISLGARCCARNREHLLMMGVTAESAETEYGWILPRVDDGGRLRAVVRFVEKPAPDVAEELLAAGALWNIFVCAGSGHALLEVFEASQPQMLRRHLQYFLVRKEEEAEGRHLFDALPRVDFCREILESAGARLRVLAVPACGWTDLGTPRRVRQWLRGSGMPTRSIRGTHFKTPGSRASKGPRADCRHLLS
jgi:mannose-1-phosphate guanylyltransferase